jgi:hypothetical protein
MSKKGQRDRRVGALDAENGRTRLDRFAVTVRMPRTIPERSSHGKVLVGGSPEGVGQQAFRPDLDHPMAS